MNQKEDFMSDSDFQFLTQSLISNYSCRGIMAKLRSPTKRVPIVLCVSTLRNHNKLVPTDCVLWKREKRLYEGKLKSGRLRQRLSRRGICCLEITCATDCEKGHGDFLCIGDREHCACSTCKCKSPQYLQIEAKYRIQTVSDPDTEKLLKKLARKNKCQDQFILSKQAEIASFINPQKQPQKPQSK